MSHAVCHVVEPRCGVVLGCYLSLTLHISGCYLAVCSPFSLRLLHEFRTLITQHVCHILADVACAFGRGMLDAASAHLHSTVEWQLNCQRSSEELKFERRIFIVKYRMHVTPYGCGRTIVCPNQGLRVVTGTTVYVAGNQSNPFTAGLCLSRLLLQPASVFDRVTCQVATFLQSDQSNTFAYAHSKLQNITAALCVLESDCRHWDLKRACQKYSATGSLEALRCLAPLRTRSVAVEVSFLCALFASPG